MAEAVDSIIARLELQYQQYSDDWKKAVAAVDGHTSAVERNNRAAARAEGEASATRKRRTSSEVQETREQERIQKAAAKAIADEQKAQAKSAAAVVAAAAKDQAVAVKAAEREKQAALRETEKAAKSAAASVGRDGLPVGPGARPINIVEPTRSRMTQAEYEAAEARRAAAVAALPERAFSRPAQAPAAPAQGVEIDREIIGRATLQAGLVASTREETAAIRDQLTQLNLVNAFKRAGLTETEAAIRAEESLLGIETRRAARAAEAVAVQTARTEKQLAGSTGKTAGAISAFAPALVGGITVHEISALNDEYIKLTNTLRVAGVGTGELDQVQAHLLATANRSGTDINALADVYRGAALASHDLGASQADLLKITDAAANALRISGRSTEEARGALLQLGHAFESGRVTAREFNSLALNAYPILQAVARGSDQYGGSVAKLRAALLEGDITSKVFFQNLLKGADDLEKRASVATLTTAQGFNALKNSLVVYFGEADKAQGVSAALGFALQKLAENLDTLIPAIAAVATALTVGYITRLGAAAVATENLGGAILAAFGGPVGIAITAVTLAIGAFAVEANRTSAMVAKTNAEYEEMREQLGQTAVQAASAASGVAGVGRDALGAIPKVNAFAGAVGQLAQQLYNQARAARAAQVAGLQQRLSASQAAETQYGEQTPTGRADARSRNRAALRRGDLLGIDLSPIVGEGENILSAGRTDRQNANAYAHQVAISRVLQKQLRDAQSAPITGNDIPGGAPVAAAAASPGGSRRGRNGPNDETLARRGDAARTKAIRDDREFDAAVRRAQTDYLSEQASITSDAAAQAQVERERVVFQRDQLAKEIASKGPGKNGTGEYSGPEVAQLQGINARTADVRLASIDQAERRRNEAALRNLDRADLEARREGLQSRQQEADTLDERRSLAKQILDLEYQIKTADLNAIRFDPTKSDDERIIATDKFHALPNQKAADERGVDRQYQGAGGNYLDGLKVDKKQFVESEEVKLLDDFNKGLDDSVKKALHLHGIFGDIIGDLIDMAIKQALLKPIANALFGGGESSGGSGGAVGGILSAIGGIFGHRATGGPVVPGASYLVGERGPEVVRFGGSAQVYPNGALPNIAGGGGGMTLHQTVNIDASGVNPEGYTKAILGIVRHETGQAIRENGRQILEATPGQLQRKQTLGN